MTFFGGNSLNGALKRGLDLEGARESAKRSFRVHIIHSKRGDGCYARMYHSDGYCLASCGGGGYDKSGTVLGDAVAALYPEQLKALPLPEREPDYFVIERNEKTPSYWVPIMGGFCMTYRGKETILTSGHYKTAEGALFAIDRVTGLMLDCFDIGRRGGNLKAGALYGLSEYEGKRSIDGACGIESVCKIIEALGFEVERYETGRYSQLVIWKVKQ